MRARPRQPPRALARLRHVDARTPPRVEPARGRADASTLPRHRASLLASPPHRSPRLRLLLRLEHVGVRERFRRGAPDANVPRPARVFACSDIHTDFPENLEWVRSLSDVDFRGDAVILGGDVSDDLEVLETTLRLYARKFRARAFVCGNHDLWTRSRGGEHRHADSMEKLDEVLRVCEACGVRTSPTRSSTATRAPTEARCGSRPSSDGTTRSFDTEPDIPESVSTVRPPRLVMSDYKLCRWPEGSTRPTSPSRRRSIASTTNGWDGAIFYERCEVETRSSAERPCSASRTFCRGWNCARRSDICSTRIYQRRSGRSTSFVAFGGSPRRADGRRRADPDPDPNRSADRDRARARAQTRARLRAHALRMGSHDRRHPVHSGAGVVPARVETATGESDGGTGLAWDGV